MNTRQLLERLVSTEAREHILGEVTIDIHLHGDTSNIITGKILHVHDDFIIVDSKENSKSNTVKIIPIDFIQMIDMRMNLIDWDDSQ